jgi:hypothetical protein
VGHYRHYHRISFVAIALCVVVCKLVIIIIIRKKFNLFIIDESLETSS